MRKSLWMLGLAAVAMTSCTQSEVLEVAENRAIGFEDVFVGKATRGVTATIVDKASDLHGDDKGFYVYGGYETVTDVFDNTHVTYSSGSTPEWGYSPIRYWVKDKYYKFVAYAPVMNVTPTFSYGTTSTPSANDATLTFTDVVIDGTVNNQKDFIVAKSDVITLGDSYTTKVQFNFFHALSMIKVTLRNGFADGVKVAISDFQITGINTKGNFTTASTDFSAGSCGTWSNQTSAETTSTFIDAGTGGTPLSSRWTSSTDDTNTSKAYSNEFIVIPQTIGTVKVKFNVTVADAAGTEIVSDKLFDVSIPNGTTTNWIINNRYHYTLTIDGKSVGLTPIEFDDPDVEQWGAYGQEEGLVTSGS
ncbi:fimbrillin family protein [Phocaeicola barnesiae]